MTLSGLKILLAEDNPTNQLVAVQMLESLGAEVVLAVDGAEALEMIQRETFDLALIDIEMPRISGIDLIRHVRALDGPVARIPMVALTAYVMREHRAAIGEAGADGIIAKPILSIDAFGDEVAHFVRRPVPSAPADSEDTDTADAGGDVAREPGAPGGGDDPAAAGIDIATFQGLRASFDAAMFAELTEKIIADVGSAAERIAAGLETEDLGELRAASHILISVAGAIGAHRLQTLAQCLNSAGHAADSLKIETTGPALLVEAEQVLTFVRQSQKG